MTSPPSRALNVLHQSYTSEVGEHDPDDDYSRPSTHTSHSITGVEIVLNPNKEPFNCVCATPLWQGQDVFVLVVVWSSGDSFGHDAGSNIEFLSAFTTLESALKAQAQIEAHYEISKTIRRFVQTRDAFQTLLRNIPLLPNPLPLVSRPPNCQLFCGTDQMGFDLSKFQEDIVEFHNDAGQVEQASVGWAGYFESLDNVFVETLKLEPPTLFKGKTFKIGKIK